MLWSLIKIVLFIAIIAALTIGAGHLTDMEGGMQIAVGDWELNLQPLQAVIGLGVLVVAIWLGLKLLGLLVAVVRFFAGDETALSRWWNRRAERRGYEALAEGLMALASGESRAAMAKAKKAETFLKRPELTNLITAQAAEMVGDARKAEETYKLLLKDERTRFVGVRGIMKQQLAKGDTDKAMKLAEKAFALKPRHEETQDVLLKLQAEHGDWTGARKTLGAKLKYGLLPRDVHRRRDAVLALGEAKSIVEEGKSVAAREAAIVANKLSPDLVPAAVMAAESYVIQDQKRQAQRVLAKAWSVQPHPDLAAAFAAIEPDESKEARLRRFQALTTKQVGHPENRMLQAELFVAAERFDDARKVMGNYAEEHPTKRSLMLMAAIERGDGSDEAVVNDWLSKALTASPGPQWICDVDGKSYAEWQPVTEGGFDTLSWREPSHVDQTKAAATGVLPLISADPEPAAVDPAPNGASEPAMTSDHPAPEAQAASDQTSDADEAGDSIANEDAPPAGDERASVEPARN